MKVIILCGGQGTRLREETEFRPKPLVSVGGRPILWHIMKHYAAHGFQEFILCLGYKGEMIKSYFLNYHCYQGDLTVDLGNPPNFTFHHPIEETGWKVTLAETGEHAMTGARIKRVERYVEGEEFMLTYGDGVCDVDLTALLKFHRQHGKIGTVTGVRPPARFGELVVEGDNVASFREKPQIQRGWISGGFFVFNRRVFDFIEDDDACNFEAGPLSAVADEGELQTWQHKGFWQCMDTFRDLQLLNRLWDENPPWKTW